MFDLQGTERENAIIRDALARSDFPWERLAPGLKEQTGRDAIPVEWADLSRYASAFEAHDHSHVHEGTDEAHIIEGREGGRRAAWGLAWYSGRITIERKLVDRPKVAQDVFLSEVAHMVDFFYLSPEQRVALFGLYHGGEVPPHDHGWFEETGNPSYWAWVGESFMAGFVYAFSDLEPYSAEMFDHPSTPEMREPIRAIVLGETAHPVFGLARSSVFHDEHAGIRRDVVWSTRDEAVAAGRRPCGVCKP